MKALRRTLLATGILAVLLLAGVAIGERWIEGPLVRYLNVHSARDIRIDGAFSVRLLALHPGLVADQVSIGNPAWAPPGQTARVSHLVIDLGWQCCLHPLRIQRVEIGGAVLTLSRDASGKANWWTQESGPGKGPPLIGSLSMPDARLTLDDERRHLKFNGSLSAADASTRDGAPPLQVAVNGQLNGRPVVIALQGEPLATAQRGHPYHYSFDERSGASLLTGRATISEPFDFRAQQLTFSATGPNMKDGYYLVGLTMPNTGPYHLTGKLDRQGKRFTYTDLVATTGQSDMSGSLLVDASSGRTRTDGALTSHYLRAADLGAKAAGLAVGEPRTPGLRIPDTPFHVTNLGKADAAIQFTAQTLVLGPQELHKVTARLTVDHAVLSVEQFRSEFSEGAVSGSARLDATQPVPRGDLSLRVSGLQMEHLKSATADAPLTGRVSGRIQLHGAGNSLHEMAASASGTVAAVVPHGALRATIADAASLDFAGALGARLRGREYTDVRCAVANLDARDGVLTAATLLIDTDQTLISGSGDIQLRTEDIDLTVHGQPKDARLALRSSVAVGGTLEHPQVKLSGHSVATAVLKLMLKPVTAALEFVDPKMPQDPDCAAFLAPPSGSVKTAGNATVPVTAPKH